MLGSIATGTDPAAAGPDGIDRLFAAMATWPVIPDCESCSRAPATTVVSWPDLDRGMEFLTCTACADAAAGVTPGAHLEAL